VRREPEVSLLGEVVDLDDDPVRGIPDRVARLFGAVQVLLDTVEIRNLPGGGVDTEPEPTEPGEYLPVGFKDGPTFDGAEVVHPRGEAPRRSDRGVFLPKRARGCVSRVDEEAFTCLRLAFIQGFERLVGHVHLTSDFEQCGRVASQAQRHGIDCPHVGRDVLADGAVTAGRRHREDALLIDQRHGEAVDLQLADVAGRGAAEESLRTGLPAFQLLE